MNLSELQVSNTGDDKILVGYRNSPYYGIMILI